MKHLSCLRSFLALLFTAPVLGAEAHPLVTAQSRDQEVPAGEPVRMFIELVEPEKWTYQWSRNEVPIDGAASPELWLDEATLEDSGRFSITIMGSDGAVSAELSATLTVREPSPISFEGARRGQVASARYPGLVYDLALPEGYSDDGSPFPVIYTFDPGGGGMVDTFLPLNSSRMGKAILVGVLESANGVPTRDTVHISREIARDVEERLNVDPSAQFVAGFSGGAWRAFTESRYRNSHIAGVISLGGWFGGSSEYVSTTRFREGLLVARANGEDDTAANSFLSSDRDFLEPQGVIVEDWAFPGGHVTPSGTVLNSMFDWLMAQRIPPEPEVREKALRRAADWRARVSAGDLVSVVRETFTVLMEEPRTYAATHAERVLRDLLEDFDAIDIRDWRGLYKGDLALDVLLRLAEAVGQLRDTFGRVGRQPRSEAYQSVLRLVPAIDGVSGDLEDAFVDLWEAFGPPDFPDPVSYDAWAQALSDSPDSTDPTARVAGGGVTHLEAYFHGFDYDGITPVHPHFRIAADGSGRKVPHLDFSRRSVGVSCRLESSRDGETWHPAVAPVQGVDRTAARSTVTLAPPEIGAMTMLHRLVLTLRESSVDTP